MTFRKSRKGRERKRGNETEEGENWGITQSPWPGIPYLTFFREHHH
jgi:hypothetical protein